MIEVHSRALDYVGAGMLIFVFLVLVYGIIYIHDIPYELSKKRNHPHQDAIHVAGWVSLLTLHVIWPFLWIWAMMHKPDLPTDEQFEEEIHEQGMHAAESDTSDTETAGTEA